MNEFTKEELEKIKEVLDRDPCELFNDLYENIQSMIDNYQYIVNRDKKCHTHNLAKENSTDEN